VGYGLRQLLIYKARGRYLVFLSQYIQLPPIRFIQQNTFSIFVKKIKTTATTVTPTTTTTTKFMLHWQI
jgi:hypothetical protein